MADDPLQEATHPQEKRRNGRPVGRRYKYRLHLQEDEAGLALIDALAQKLGSTRIGVIRQAVRLLAAREGIASSG